MKLGLISDIHADIDSLQTALDRLARLHQVDEILCAGDLTGYGRDPNAVIALIRARNIPTVRGNHDSPSAEITPENAAFLRSLGFNWQAEYDGVRMLMCHGMPGMPFIGLHPDYTPDSVLNAHLKDYRADVIVAGHTHVPMCKWVENGLIVNPGALSGESESHSYAVLELPDLTFTLYDILESPETDYVRPI